MNKIWLFLIMLSSIINACKVQQFISPTETVSIEQAFAMAEKNVLMIDVRETDEVMEQGYNVKKIINVPLSEMESRLSEIPKDQQIILACRSGNRSAQAYGLLKQNGYKNLTNMEGGMLAWEENGLPIFLITRKPNIKPDIIDEMGSKAIKGELSACALDTLKQHEDQYTDFLLQSNPKDIFEVSEVSDFLWQPDLKNDFQKTDILNKERSKCD